MYVNLTWSFLLAVLYRIRSFKSMVLSYKGASAWKVFSSKYRPIHLCFTFYTAHPGSSGVFYFPGCILQYRLPIYSRIYAPTFCELNV